MKTMLGLYARVLPQSALSSVHGIHNTVTLELETKVIEGWRRFHNYGEKPYYRVFSWLKPPTSTNTFTFKKLSSHYAKQASTQGKNT